MTIDPITLEDPTETFLRRLYIPLWCLLWIELVVLGTYYLTSSIPEILDYSFMHFGDNLVVARDATVVNAVLIALVCVFHRRIEAWVLWLAPQVQMYVKEAPEGEEAGDEDDEE
jgi:hypothetical protein